MNNQGNRFFDGLILGAVLGGAAVFLLGTRTGKNLLRILSEQGLEGLTNVLEEYDLSELDDAEEFPEEESSGREKSEEKPAQSPAQTTKEVVKKRFFKRIRR